ncbi:MAG: RagB/SusD family nutrient uptake outer membrane protein, partial [Cytophagales bacterium]|nr:RagB/SusD family nutrient uptake outer membrane protein [Cytophagales bacterium]
MMKINKSFWILMVVFLGLSSCEDEILDKETRSEFNEEVAWESPEMVQVFLNSLYSEFEMDAGMLYECLGDDYETTKNSKIWTINKDLVNSSNFDAGWSFRELRKANQVITRLSGESKIEMNEAERANLLGQAHFFRAWTLFQKAKVFGGLILLEKVMKPDDDFDLPRATEEDTWTYIIKEFRKSADYLKGQNVENYRVSYGA